MNLFQRGRTDGATSFGWNSTNISETFNVWMKQKLIDDANNERFRVNDSESQKHLNRYMILICLKAIDFEEVNKPYSLNPTGKTTTGSKKYPVRKLFFRLNNIDKILSNMGGKQCFKTLIKTTVEDVLLEYFLCHEWFNRVYCNVIENNYYNSPYNENKTHSKQLKVTTPENLHKITIPNSSSEYLSGLSLRICNVMKLSTNEMEYSDFHKALRSGRNNIEYLWSISVDKYLKAYEHEKLLCEFLPDKKLVSKSNMDLEVLRAFYVNVSPLK